MTLKEYVSSGQFNNNPLRNRHAVVFIKIKTNDDKPYVGICYVGDLITSAFKCARAFEDDTFDILQEQYCIIFSGIHNSIETTAKIYVFNESISSGIDEIISSVSTITDECRMKVRNYIESAINSKNTFVSIF